MRASYYPWVQRVPDVIGRMEGDDVNNFLRLCLILNHYKLDTVGMYKAVKEEIYMYHVPSLHPTKFFVYLLHWGVLVNCLFANNITKKQTCILFLPIIHLDYCYHLRFVCCRSCDYELILLSVFQICAYFSLYDVVLCFELIFDFYVAHFVRCKIA